MLLIGITVKSCASYWDAGAETTVVSVDADGVAPLQLAIHRGHHVGGFILLPRLRRVQCMHKPQYLAGSSYRHRQPRKP